VALRLKVCRLAFHKPGSQTMAAMKSAAQDSANTALVGCWNLGRA
jgi:hypothetical protein